jgi:YlmC/YmxH family sporulation protein
MIMRMSELSGKEVINLADGGRLGVIGECELTFDEQTGKISSILLPNKGGLLSLFGDNRFMSVPWYTLKRIGDEVIIVELNGATERHAKFLFDK